MATRPLVGDETVRPARGAPVGAERRSDCRFHTVMRVARVSRTGDAGIWRVRNISDGGMMLATSATVTVGERLGIALSDSVVVSARVAWADGEHCGVALDEPIDCVAMLRQLVDEQRRPRFRQPRLPVSARAILYLERGLVPVQLINISKQGAGFTHDGSIQAGMTGKLVLPSGAAHRGVVRWSKDGRAGMLLTEPIPAARLESTARL